MIIILPILFIITLLYIFPIIRVCEDSMLPTYHDGDILISFRLPIFFKKFFIKTGRVYIIKPPLYYENQRLNIKRLTKIKNKNMYFFEGDNKIVSYDSRSYGYLPKRKIFLLVLFKLKKGK